MEKWPKGLANAEKLRGDASDREFYRLRVEGAGSAVLMVLAEPHRGGELPFINIGNHLAAMGVSVPELYAYDEERGLLLLEDAGDFTLQEELAGKGDEVYRKYYRMAIDELGKIHYDSGRDSEKHCVAGRLAACRRGPGLGYSDFDRRAPRRRADRGAAQRYRANATRIRCARLGWEIRARRGC